MNVSAQADKRSLNALLGSIKTYEQASGKDTADVVNHALKQVAIFWSHHMPMADRTKIEDGLRRVVAYQIAGKGKKYRRLKKAKAIKKALPLAYAIVLARAKRKGEKIPAGDLTARANRMINARKSSAGFNRAGIIPALRAFGAPLKNAAGARQIGRPKGTASKATAARLVAKLSNKVKTVAAIGKPSLDTAVAEAAVDLRKYAERKIAQRVAAFNAGRPGAGVKGLDY